MGMIQCCLRGEPQDMHTGEPRRDGITGQQQGTPTTPNSASMIPRNLVSQISFHQGQQQSQQGYQPPGLGVQQQPTGLLAHQMQVDQSNSYVTISFPFQATGSGQGGQPAIVQSSIQVPGAITYPSPRAIQQPANFAAPPTAITGVVAPPKETSSPQPKQGVFTDTNPTGMNWGKWTEKEPQVGTGTEWEDPEISLDLSTPDGTFDACSSGSLVADPEDASFVTVLSSTRLSLTSPTTASNYLDLNI